MFPATKDPNEILDYAIDWGAEWLDGDTITASVWDVPADDVTIQRDTFTDTLATVWLSGGTLDTVSRVYNTITTAAGRNAVRIIELTVTER